METTKYTKLCPKCGKQQAYKSIVSYNKAVKENSNCRYCCNRIYTSQDDFLERYNKGLSDRQIAKELKICHKTVASRRQQLGLKPNIDARKKTEIIGNQIKCSKCGELKPFTSYQKGRPNEKASYRFSYCNDCRKKKVCERLTNDVGAFLEERFRRVKGRAKAEGLDFTFTKEEWKEIYNRQEGKCFYTDKKMLTGHGLGSFPETLSADRIDNTKGYVKGNVVFCCRRVNTIKSNLTLEELEEYIPKWYERIKNYEKEN